MKKTKEKRKGISLIVLVITIIVIIVLAVAIILTLSKNNPIESAKESVFKNDMKAMQEELNLYISNKYVESAGVYNSKKLFADKNSLTENDNSVEGKTIKDVITSISNKYLDKVEVSEGKLLYASQENIKELEWADEILKVNKDLNYVKIEEDNVSKIELDKVNTLKSLKIYGNSVQENVLPSEYQQVEYIEATGEQYIELDYIASGNTIAKGSYQLTTDKTASILFGSRKDATSRGYALNWGGTTPYTYINTYNAGGTPATTTKTVDTLKHTFEKRYGELYIDDELINNKSKQTFITPNNMVIFGCSTNGTISHKCKAKIYNLQFYDDDTLKVDLIPCYRKSDNEIGLYDIVNNKFYTNAGTGTFLKGIIMYLHQIHLLI